MNLEKRIENLLKLAEMLDERNEELQVVIEKAYQNNKWFTYENIWLALRNISEKFLNESKLEQWLSQYDMNQVREPKNVALIMAGNIPLVGFHDFLCVMISGHKALIKLSSKDDVLFPFLFKSFLDIDEEVRDYISVSEIIKGMDAAIATGSDNSSRYFRYYFGKYPHIIRKHRNGVAVLTGDESGDEFHQLGFDIFSYFGLGCRNISKLMVPEGYNFNVFFESLESFSYLNEHNKYKNNYDYNQAVWLMNKTPHLANSFLILKEDSQVASPVATLHYEFYSNEEELEKKLQRDRELIQCIAGRKGNFIPFGTAQSPELWNYADNVDTMKFLLQL